MFIPSNSGNTYQSINIYNTSGSSGTFTYTQTSSSQANISINDSVGGLGMIGASFSSANSGNFYLTANSYPGASQSGSFNFASANALSSIVGKHLPAPLLTG
jgi:hypothetical protein